MAYCTDTDLITRYGEYELTQLTDRARVGAIDGSVLDQAIADAGAEIDGYLATAGYPTPLVAAPYVLTRYACDLARWYLYDEVRPDAVQRGADQARNWLERIADGRYRLPGLATDDTTAAVGDVLITNGRDSAFPGGGY